MKIEKEKWRKKSNERDSESRKVGAEPWTWLDSNTSHDKRGLIGALAHRLKCFLHTSAGTDTCTDTSLQ